MWWLRFFWWRRWWLLLNPSNTIVNKSSKINPDLKSGFILLIAPARSYRVASYINASQKLGYQLLIVSDSKHSLVSSIASGITIDFSQPDLAFNTILSSIRLKNILAVIATDDLVVTLSSKVAKALGLAFNEPESTRLTYRKDLARIRLKEKKCNVPNFDVCHFDDVITRSTNCKYPVVLKPLMLSGSRGVIRANNTEEFITASERIQKILSKEQGSDYEKNHFLIEQFLQGNEIAVDGFVQNGRFITLSLFDKPDPLNGPYFEESFYITPSRHSSSVQQDIKIEIEKCCKAYGLTHGPIHAEARITDKGIFLIEMASRTIGGQCAQLIEYVLGLKLEEVIIRLMCFEQLELDFKQNHAGVLMIPIKKRGILKRVEGLMDAQQVKHISNIEIHIHPGYELVPLPEGSSYLGFIFASAETFSETLSALREAHAKLKFITSESWSLEPA
ncbi:MAG: ATP-grasp domain-containing protein [Gammaproteobacteria bacterium]|nr:ATP-grasp domain-containing protein [Gammaproteobacteria bacterium]MBT4075589.1 ATP-grasp domain-containing protein [Gammaproteobacteria bacterium]MBT4194877.1 ATP-grasp domain-containing protein [Gammaproteobacteria bacterium]MBT4448076.1 ATP-grasp domain-containing protein [Gammaproteobacteria bacterium]MBT4860092.1 ATP-grasp domain-containing protein [Gammaproteobacteria bacterium]